ncbi:MAG: aminotransferase class III-fold pyridoxal phosphate-dependent enzyme [Chitinophagaceae bacterium]
MIRHLIHSMIVCPDMDKTYPRISHGKGVYLYDENGKEYLDASSGSAAVSNIGHGLEAIGEVMKVQAAKVSVLPTHAFSSSIVEDYLRQLVDFAPKGFARAWTVMSGTEAVENAIKLSLQYQQLIGCATRYKILARWGSYHGNSVFTLDVGGMKLRRTTYSKWMNNFPHIQPAYAYRKPADMSMEEYSIQCSSELEKTIVEEGPDTIAAFVVEPVVAAALGAVPPPPGYFKEIRRICSQYGVVLIADEILTGFGRTGKNFGLDNFDIIPDIIAAGKGISGGYFPLSAVIAHSKITLPFEETKMPFLGGHTFACNPIGAAVGMYVLEFLKKHDIVKQAGVKGEIFLKKLTRLYKYDIVGDVRGVGLLAGIELVSDRLTKSPFPKEMNVSKRIGEKSISKGVILYPGKGSADGASGDHIMITPPLIIEEHQLERIVSVLEESISEVMAELKNELNMVS